MPDSRLYAAALDYLYTHLPSFSHLGKTALKPKLDNILDLTNRLGNPHLKYKTIHVAGTNGKGSTSHLLCAALMKAGYKVGLYTSPHLVDFRERIRIKGLPVSQDWIVDFIEKNKSLLEDIHPSFFEATVAMAFKAFEDYGVEVAVIETGLGGRLDSTNIIQPDLCIITNIDFDHKDVLGHSLSEIASEKAGIFKPNTPVVIGHSTEETESVFLKQSLRTGSKIYYAQNHWEVVSTPNAQNQSHLKAIHLHRQEIHTLACELLGHYQIQNIKTTLTAVDVLAALGYRIDTQNALDGIAQVARLTGIRGRWEEVSATPKIIADVAHNPAGIEPVMEQWQNVGAERKMILCGFVRDKDVQAALRFFPKNETLYCVQATIPRAMPAETLATIARNLGFNAKSLGSIQEGFLPFVRSLKNEDALLIVGSFFVVGECLEILDGIKQSPADC